MESSDSSSQINETLKRLRHESLALVGKDKNQPVLLYRHKHWHLLSLGSLVDQKFRCKRGISNINFMSAARARKYVTEELNFCKLVPFEQVFPHFEDEMAAKILPSAADYRSLLQQEWVVIAGGFTTDTLHDSSVSQNNIETLLAHLEEMIKQGQRGPFLHFDRYFTVFNHN